VRTSAANSDHAGRTDSATGAIDEGGDDAGCVPAPHISLTTLSDIERLRAFAIRHYAGHIHNPPGLTPVG